MHPKNLSIKNYSYHLPDEKIAKFPLPERDQAKLLVYKQDEIIEDFYGNIASHLPEKSLLVFNNTKVIAARLLFQKATGGIVEVFILEMPGQQPMNQKGKISCKCLIGGAGKWKHGQVMEKHATINGVAFILTAGIAERAADSFVIEFTWRPGDIVFEEVLSLCGAMPIPPYLKRQAEVSDKERYQTIFATHNGSVAAPTAGLHFTTKVFESCKQKNIDAAFITLHVGAGTFMPVKSVTMEGHTMHAEHIIVNQALLLELVNYPQKIFAVGTTSLRTLESIYWMGVKCFLKPDISHNELAIKQWEPYEEISLHSIEISKALHALLDWMALNMLGHLFIKTQILIAPGYRPKMIKGLITNFHQPNSTLLLLVAALIGEDWRKVYRYALENDFRFLSYGDGCLMHVR